MPTYPPGGDDHLFFGYLVISWTAFYLALLLYDRLKTGRFHILTLGSLAATYAVYAMVYAMAPA